MTGAATIAVMASGPSFSTAGVLLIFLFLADAWFGPLSALVVILAVAARRGGWPRLLKPLAAVNLGVGLVLLAASTGDDTLTLRMASQVLVAGAVLAALARPRARAAVFGAPPPAPTGPVPKDS